MPGPGGIGAPIGGSGPGPIGAAGTGGRGAPGGTANGAPGTASPKTATGPYFAMTSPRRPYVSRKKNAGRTATMVPLSNVESTMKKVGMRNSTPKNKAAFRAFS